MAERTARARVVQTLGKHHEVWDGERVFPAFPGGRLGLSAKRMKNRVAVGDEVVLRLEEEGHPLLEEVLPRRNALSRKITFTGKEHVVAANMDQLAVMLAPNPSLNTNLLDRYLVAASSVDLPVILLVNKMDLLEAEEAEEALQPYEAMGLPIFPMIATTGSGIESFYDALPGKWTLLVGHTGVGKTTLTNGLNLEIQRAVADVDERGKGRHTTTSALAHFLPHGGVLVDTAGIREFALWGVTWRGIESAFPEIVALNPMCKFPDCRHKEEPHCAVREAAEREEISFTRYASYVTLLDEAEEF